jgi:hypothetical protein
MLMLFKADHLNQAASASAASSILLNDLGSLKGHPKLDVRHGEGLDSLALSAPEPEKCVGPAHHKK